MAQTIQLTVTIPETHILLKVEEFEEYKKLELKGKYFNLKQLSERINRSEDWIKTHVINNPRNRKQIQSFTKFSEGRGNGYLFHAEKILDWLHFHFEDVCK